MSENENKETKDAKPGKTLSLKRTVESGQVRQNFSHGRSKSVVVEKRRKRVVTPDQAAKTKETEAAPAPAKPAEEPKTSAG